MQLEFHVGKDGGSLTARRQSGDPRFYGEGHAKGENNLFYFIKKALRKAGLDVIKKGAIADGHMLNAYQPIIRIRSPKATPSLQIHNANFAIVGAQADWNKGGVYLTVTKAFDAGVHLGRELKKALKGKYGISVKVME